MELSRVVQFLKRFAPTELAETWDNVGLLLEPSRCLVKDVLLTNDLTEEVFEEAVAKNANLIISYHPPIFSSFKRLTQATWKSRIIIGCIERKIALYSPHTSWDHVQGGVNDWLAKAFISHSPEVEPISRIDETAGVGRMLTLRNSIPFDEAVAAVQKYLGLKHVRVARPLNERGVSKVALCAGSGTTVFNMTKYENVDLLLTGEMSHHDVLNATAKGCYVILCEHSNTERGFLHAFKITLEKNLPEVTVSVSTTDRDPLTVVGGAPERVWSPPVLK